MPKVPPAQIVPAAKPFSYLYFIITGNAASPIDTTAAPTIPVQAAKTMHTMITAMATPPRKGPMSKRMASKRSSAMPDLTSKFAMNINITMATRIPLSMVPMAWLVNI